MDTLTVALFLLTALVVSVAVGVALYRHFRSRSTATPDSSSSTQEITPQTLDSAEPSEVVSTTPEAVYSPEIPEVTPQTFNPVLPSEAVSTTAEGVRVPAPVLPPSHSEEAEDIDASPLEGVAAGSGSGLSNDSSRDSSVADVLEEALPINGVHAPQQQEETEDVNAPRAFLVEARPTLAEMEKAPEAPPESKLPPSTTAHRPPIGRGGRPRGSQTESEDKPRSSQKKGHLLKPEVVCWKKGRRWLVGLDMPEELQEDPGLVVAHNGIPLTRDDEGQWLLSQVTGNVSIVGNEVDHSLEIDLGDKPLLLFELTGQTLSRGRFVRYATSGWFLAVVPDQWQRNEEVSESAPMSPESVFLPGYQAHYFSLDRDGNQKIAFHTLEDESVIVPTRAPRFDLVGTRLPDATENIGPLFGEGPPQIRAFDENVWSEVRTIVVGQEGSGKRRWRAQFSPVPGTNEQEFPPELSKRSGGWYFLRFYDFEDRLSESLDFRFVSALKDIRISPHSALPAVNGHLPARVEFLHGKVCVVRLAEDFAENLSVEYEDERASAMIPPNPIWDQTRWLIQTEGDVQVEATILVERVWWAIGEEGMEEIPSKWVDVPLRVSRDLVTATSKHALYFRLPRPRWAKKIRVGFERWRARSYYVEVANGEVAVPLSHFEGTQELEDRAHESMLRLWVDHEASQSESAIIAIIPAIRCQHRV